MPFGAAAQSTVSVYGVADAAVAVEDTGEPGRGSRKVLNSGNQSSSRFGLRGSEDLGGGLRAAFNLEAGLALDTGTADSAFWGRRAVVGLESGLGSVFIGREYSPVAAVAAASDIFGQGFFGTNLSAFTSGRLTRRLSNAISLRSAPFGGLRATVAASASEGATGSSRLVGGAAEYSAGRLYVGAGYHDFERVTGQGDKEYGLGIGWGFGGVDLKGNYLVADPAGAGNKFEQYNVGASFALGINRLFANLQQSRLQGGAKGTTLAASYWHSLSKRTNLYASYARLSNNASGRFGITSSGTSVTPAASAAGADPSVLAFGVRHLF